MSTAAAHLSTNQVGRRNFNFASHRYNDFGRSTIDSAISCHMAKGRHDHEQGYYHSEPGCHRWTWHSGFVSSASAHTCSTRKRETVAYVFRACGIYRTCPEEREPVPTHGAAAMESAQPDPYRYNLPSWQRAASSRFTPKLHCTGWCRVDIQLAFRECTNILD